MFTVEEYAETVVDVANDVGEHALTGAFVRISATDVTTPDYMRNMLEI